MIPTSETKTYGTPTSGYTITSNGGAISSYSISPNVPVGLSFSTSSGLLSWWGPAVPVQAPTTYMVTGTNISGSAIAAAYTLEVTPAALSVTADSDQTKVYGTDDPTLTYTTSGLLPGDLLSGALDRDSGENVGSYAITQGDLANVNYAITFNSADFAITQAAMTITVDSDQTKVYGTDDPTLTYATAGLLPGDSLSGALSRDSGEDVGSYAITQGDLGNTNYSVTFNGADFAITPAPTTVTADSDQNKVYGTDDPTLTYTTAGLLPGDSLSGALGRDSGENVGSYAITRGDLGNTNYSVTFNGADFAITPAELTVTADNLSKTYGDDDPTLSYSVTGLVGTDSLSGALGRVLGEDVGTYAIGLGDLSVGSNYTLVFNGGTFTIDQKDVTVVADKLSKTYGDADPTLTYSVSGLLGADSLFGALGRVLGEDVGAYAIGLGDLSVGSNYNLVFTGGTLTIDPKELTVTANNLSKAFGAGDPTLTYVATGFAFGDGYSVFSNSLVRDAGESVGTYTIGQGSLSAGVNYSIVFNDGEFTIVSAAVTPTFAWSCTGVKQFSGDQFKFCVATAVDPGTGAEVPGTMSYSSSNTNVFTVNGDIGHPKGSFADVAPRSATLIATFTPSDPVHFSTPAPLNRTVMVWRTSASGGSSSWVVEIG